jgi:hypothetical protein
MSRRLISLIAGIAIGLFCLLLAAALLFFLSPKKRNVPFVTPMITIVTAPPIQFTSTPDPQATISPTQQDGIPPDPGGIIEVGISVRVSGTGGDGLRLRRDPGTNGVPIFLGAENEVFVVKGGPETVDNFTWWFLEAPYDTARAGWAVSNYLIPFVEE